MRTKEQAIGLLEAVVGRVKNGTSRSVHEALKHLNKNRKTVERFKHIYYLNCVNKDLLSEVRCIHIYVHIPHLLCKTVVY